MKVKPTGMLLMMLAGWINRHQQDVIMKIRVSLVQAQFTGNRSISGGTVVTMLEP